jgi:hypothetical protein
MSAIRLLICLLILVSCGTVRLRVKSDYKTQDKGGGSLVYEKSYDLGGYKWLCRFTGLMYGGGCWTYNFMPFEGQANKLVDDAKDNVRKKLNTSRVDFFAPYISQISWNDEPETIFLSEDVPNSSLPIAPRSEGKEKPEEDDFLR